MAKKELMKVYCVVCKKQSSFDQDKVSVEKTKNNRLMLKGKCATCKKNVFRFVSEKDAKEFM